MKKILLILVALLATTTVWAEDYITDVMVIGGSKTETDNLKASYTAQGWTVIDQDLNSGCGSGSDYIYLLYKKASETNAGVEAFITDFIVSTSSETVPDNITLSNGTYHLVTYDGSDYFKNNKGDLNSHCGSGSANIHLYYTKEYALNGTDYGTVKSISFNNTQSGAVTTADGSTGYDLNTGCGSGSDYIYMHANKSQGWLYSTNGTECIINGFDGPKTDKRYICIPTYLDQAKVIGIHLLSFGGFTNLERMHFSMNSSVEQMPSVKGCSKFYNVSTGTANYRTPSSMTIIPGNAFEGTAVESIEFTGVKNFGSYVFSGSNVLSSVTFNVPLETIEHDALSNISSNCQVSYPGSIEDWSPTMYSYSQELVIHNGNSWYCGWCGGANEASHNMLYWTVADAHLKISSYGDWWDDYPDKQVIASNKWRGWQVLTSITLERVYSIGQRQFEDLTTLKNLYLDPTLHSIGKEAFFNCVSLNDIWFDGTKQQWDNVEKDATWNYTTPNPIVHCHCLVTFNANGHGTAPDPVSIQWSNYDKLNEPTAPTADGYEFKGWYTNAACTNQWNFNNVVPGDMTLYAGWEEIVVNVPGDVDGDGVVTSYDVTALYNFLLNGDDSGIVNGDQDGDGVITSSDITAVYSIMLGSKNK